MTHQIRRPFGRTVSFGLIIFTAISLTTAPTELAAQSVNVTNTTGSGTYICTPAGFGSKSRCFRR